MTTCKYFLEGRCRFGQNCRNEHSYNADNGSNRVTTASTEQLKNILRQIVNEVVIAEKGGQWPLSCFAPFMEGMNIPGWEDISPEEVRWKMYAARRNGTLNQCINEVKQLYSEAEKKRNALKQPTIESINLIVQILKGKKEPTNISNPFISSNQNNSSSIFGGSSSSAGSQNIFKDVGRTGGNIFGTQMQPLEGQGNIFGGNSTNYAYQNIFGGSNSSNNFSQNIFSNSQSPAQNSFLNSSLSSNQPIFSNMQTAMNETVANSNVTAFSNPAATGAFSNQVNSAPIFASQDMLFSSSNNITQSPSIFGGTQTENVFNNPNSLVKSTENFKFEVMNTNQFGNQTQSTNAFISNQPISIDYSLYSKTEDLTAEELQAFAAATFSFGKIPVKPPPLESCK